MMCFWAN